MKVCERCRKELPYVFNEMAYVLFYGHKKPIMTKPAEKRRDKKLAKQDSVKNTDPLDLCDACYNKYVELQWNILDTFRIEGQNK